MDKNRVWDLCVKKVNDELDANEEKEFEKIKGYKETQKALRQVKLIRIKSSNSFLIQKIDKEKNWKHINRQISQFRQVRNFLMNFSKYAAIFLIALLVGVMVPKLFTPESQETKNRIELERGQMGKITLSDGTQVWLNSGTIFEYPTTFDNKERSVTLIGEAQFKVTHNDKVPFEVKTKTGIIKVYGTTFDVSAYKDDPDLTVTLIEGVVTVEKSNGNYLATLKPSEQLRINKHSGQTTIQQVNTDFYSSWIDGKIYLNRTKLSELVIMLERWYNVNIQLVGDKVGDIEVSGTISKGKSLNPFLKILERMYGVKCELKAYNNKKDEIIISKN